MVDGNKGEESCRNVDLGPRDARGFFERGCKCLEKGEWHSAIEDLNSALGIDKGFAEAYVKRAHAFRYLGFYGRALDDVRIGLGLDPSSAEAHLVKGRVYSAIKERSLAIDSFTECIKLDAECSDAYEGRALDHWMLTGEIEQPIEDLKKAITLQPGEASAHMAMGVLLGTRLRSDITNDRYSLAIEYFNSAIGIVPKYADLHFLRGSVFLELGEPDRAISDLDMAIELGGGSIVGSCRLYRTRGNAYFYKKNFGQAMADLNLAIESNPLDAGSLSDRGGVQRAMGDYKSAVRDYSRAIALLSDSDPGRELPALYISRATCFRVAGVGPDALDHALLDVDRALNINPNSVEAYLERAKVHMARGDLVRYEEDLEKTDALLSEDTNGLVWDSRMFTTNGAFVFLGMNSQEYDGEPFGESDSEDSRMASKQRNLDRESAG